MALNKKSMFFTIMAMSIIALMMVGFTGTHQLMHVKDTDIIESEFSLLNTHKKNVEKYARNVLVVQSNHAVADMINYIDNGGSIDDTNTRFQELVMQGTLYGSEANAPNMDGISVKNWTKRMDNRSNSFLSLESNMTLENPRLTQSEPWTITPVIDLVINATAGNLSYNVRVPVRTNFSLVGYIDPLYLYHGFENNITVTKTFFFNATRTYHMVKNRTYRHAGLGPNFIMRLEENYSNSTCCGIQSLVNNSMVANPSQFDRSFVDYLFWGGKRNCSVGNYSLYNFTYLNGQPESFGFKLDGQFMNVYGMNISDTPGLPYCSP